MHKINDTLRQMPFTVRFKNRYPDPGLCRVISLNFENEKCEVSNGAVRLWPSFDDVIFYME